MEAAIQGGFYAKMSLEGKTTLASSVIENEARQMSDEEIEAVLFIPIDGIEDVDELGFIHTALHDLLPIIQVGALLDLPDYDCFLEMAEDKLATIQERIMAITAKEEEEDNDDVE